MTLSEEDLRSLSRAREARRTEEFLARYKEAVERSRLRHETSHQRRIPSPERMREPFDF